MASELSQADKCVVCGFVTNSMHCESKTCVWVKCPGCRINDLGKKAK